MLNGMSGKNFRYLFVMLVCVSLLGGFGHITTESQSDEPVVISFVPPFPLPDVLTEDFFAPFEEANPGVRVAVVDSSVFVSPPGGNIQRYLAEMVQYASTADVISVSRNLSPFASRAGIVLDMAPLVRADESFDMDTAYAESIANLYQWDDGIWALPAGVTMTAMRYNRAVFDAAGLSYPGNDWTLDDYRIALDALRASRDTPPLGYSVASPVNIVASMIGSQMVNENGLPQFNQNATVNAMRQWAELNEQNLAEENLRGSPDDFPVFLTTPGFVPDDATIGYAALPGGHVILQGQGLAVSSGTAHPELAYELSKYLAEALPAQAGYITIPARNDIPADERVEGLTNLLPYALNPSQTRYLDYLHLPVVRATPDVSADVLADVDQQIQNDLETASNYDRPVSVQEVEVPARTPDDVVLEFGVQSGMRTLPNERLLNSYVEEFVAARPNLDRLVIEAASTTVTGEDLTGTYDCFYSNQRTLVDMAGANLLDFAPLTEADAGFSTDNFLPGVLSQLEVNQQLMGYPLTVHPVALRYNPALLEASNATLPASDWTGSSFDVTVRTIWQNDDSVPVIEPLFDPGSTYLLMLTAAYGGLPVDYRQNPPTIQFTDETHIRALRQVLDMARTGIIGYAPLTRTSTQVLGGPPFFVDNLQEPLPNNYLSYRLINFPTSSQYRPVSYTIGLGFISAETAHPELCYDWLTTLADRPNLLNGYPTRQDIPDIDVVTGALGADGQRFFESFQDSLAASTTVIFPSQVDRAERNILNEAFDNYVLDGANLESELENAQLRIQAYRDCRANNPESSPNECVDS